MVHISPINALDYELTGIAEACDDLHGVLVNAVRHEIFCQGTVIAIRDLLFRSRLNFLDWWAAFVIQIFHIHKVDVAILITIALVASYESAEYFFTEECWTNS